MISENCNSQQREKISEFEKELASLRKATRVSQSKLGKKIGLSRQFISEIELGKAQISWATYVAAVKFFMVNGSKTITAFINEHSQFVEEYMKEGAGNTDEN